MVYEGNQDYIFVSYAHKDSQKVMPLVETLQQAGFRLWYDAGIEAGTEWPEYIEEHLSGARVVLVFMTPSTVESKNCRNEINFALELEKDVLVVYLEDTPLIKGMRLQLNSTQSLFRAKHLTQVSFVQELVDARVLQVCREAGTGRTDAPQRTERSRGRQTIISNVCSIGTNDPDDVWPSGVYSQIINRDRFRVITFHMTLLKPFGFSGTVGTHYQVYNSRNELIFDEESTLRVEHDYVKVAKCWIVRGLDGSFIPSGEYRFVCSINNSAPFSYSFTVTSDAEERSGNSILGKLKKLLGI